MKTAEKGKITNDGEFETGYNELVRLMKDAEGIIKHLASPKHVREMLSLEREKEKDSRYLFSLKQKLSDIYKPVHDYADVQQDKGRGIEWTDNFADISRRHCRIVSLENALTMYGNYLESKDDTLELPAAELRSIIPIPVKPYFKILMHESKQLDTH